MKELRSSRSTDAFAREVAALKRFNGKANNHLIQLLATFTQDDKQSLLFPWADGGNLRDFWRSNKEPLRTTSSSHMIPISWILEQLLGLADALAALHNDKALGGSYRHGDIKPENILWFRTDSHDTSGSNRIDLGSLKISDFGLATYHSKETVSDRKSLRGFTQTYRPPECDVRDYNVSSKYDIWTLGCVYLEFITWLLDGWQGVDQKFPTARTTDTSHPEDPQADDSFFSVSNGSAKVKPAVTEVRRGPCIRVVIHNNCLLRISGS